MKKLAIVYPAYYKENSGGAELQISYLCQAARAAGWEVHYIYVPNANAVNGSANEILHPLPPCRKRAHFFRYQKQILLVLSQIQPDVLYTRHSSSWVYFVATYARHNQCPHVHALASDHVAEMHGSWRNLRFPFRWYENVLLRKGMCLVQNFITQNNFQQQQIRRIFGIDGTLIGQMTPRVSAGQIHKNNSPVDIYWIGNLKGLKQPELFIELVHKMAIRPPEHQYRFFMCGRMAPAYRELIKNAETTFDNFQYLGELSQTEVNSRLVHAHLLVNTSIYEGFSNTFVQAWMRQVPVLSMNSDPDETLSRHGLGRLIPKIDEMAQQLRALIDDPSARRAMGERAQKYAYCHHSLEENMPKLLTLLEGHCGNTAR